MTTGFEVVDEARTWLDTPFAHQESFKGVACDCAGLLRGVAGALGLLTPEQTVALRAFLGYSRVPDGESMRRACDTFLIPIEREQMGPGDLVLLIVDRYPQHLGIVTDHAFGCLGMIHAAQPAGRVLESRLVFNRALRYVQAYRFPGVT